jgi:hypothetical protein
MKLDNIHGKSLATSTALSSFAVANAITPLDVVSVLNKAGVSFVLVGAHGLSGWMDEPRATQDVDVIVADKHHTKAVTALLAAFPDLEVSEAPVVTRLREPNTKKVVLDLMRPNQQLFRSAFRHTKTVEVKGQRYRIPSLEMALAMKFALMVSLHRQDEDKYQDAHDFILMIKANPKIDLKKLSEMGELVYSGGGDEIVEMVRRVRAGEQLNLSRNHGQDPSYR